MKLVALLALTALLAGCVAAPPPRRQVPPDQVKGELLHLAQAEWTAFGKKGRGQVADYLPDRIVVDPVGRFTEDDRAVYPRLVAYWGAVGETGFSSYDDCFGSWERVRDRKCPWHLPWSAAFISYLMLQSGVTADDFTPDESHSVYLQPIIAATMAGHPGRLVARNIDQRAPRPGDLMCSTRGLGEDAPKRFQELLGRTVPMHCDVVVANRGDHVEGIGGNVFNAVSKSVVGARNGYLDRDNGRAWVVVVENDYPDPPAASAQR